MSALSELKAELRVRGIHLKKKLGQHLLIDGNIREKFAESADLSENDTVIEIGAGTGYMTEVFAARAGHVTAIEFDRGLAGYLQDKFARTPNVRIIHEDVLRTDLAALSSEAMKGSSSDILKVLGSLPYYITSPIIMKVVESHLRLKLCAFIMQNEVADRYAAQPGSKLYGSITIYLKYRFRIEKIAWIGKRCFYPQPKVDSALVRMTPLEKAPFSLRDEKLFFKIVRGGFMYRRKMLKNSLCRMPEMKNRSGDIDAAFIASGIKPETRPEELAPEDFARLANALTENSGT